MSDPLPLMPRRKRIALRFLSGPLGGVVCNVPTACNRATADFLLSSPLTGQEYQRPNAVPAQHGGAARSVTVSS
jgi:hypothetical protein